MSREDTFELKERTYSKGKHRFLVGNPGQRITMALARELGLVPAVKESAPAEDKALAPAENKSAFRKVKK